MTEYLIDMASYQQGINLNVVKAAGFNKVNIKLSQGNWYVWSNANTYINQATSLGMGVCTFHWLDNSTTGSAQAKIVQDLMKKYGGPQGWAHQCDCEDTKKPATWAIWRDYINSMQDFLQRHVVNYTGDWWWPGHMGNNNGAAITPHLWAAPNDGYKPSYPGDSSSDWHAGYGGWGDYHILQYAVSAIPNAGGGQISKSAIKDPSLWAELTGGEMTDPNYGNYGTPPNPKGPGNRPIAVTIADLWCQEFEIGGPYNPDSPTKRTQRLMDMTTALDEIKTAITNLSVGGIDVDALASQVAEKLIASDTNGLTPADHSAVVEDVKTALREGTGQ
jgi:hypothetical protein